MPADRHNLSSRKGPVMHRPSISGTSEFDCPPMPQVAQLAQAPQPSQTAPVPPQNLDAEESVLGAMMISPGAIGAVSEVLDASDFYRESHARIYRAALALYAKGEPVDAITLVDELEERGELEEAGGRVRLHELAALVPASGNAGHYARIVREMATLRGLITPARRSRGSAGTVQATPAIWSTGPNRWSSTFRRRASRANSATSTSS